MKRISKPDPVIIKRDTLYKEVWSVPVMLLAKKYDMSDVGLAKICEKLHIPRPPRGYWTKHSHGHRVRRPALKPLPEGGRDRIVIDKSAEQIAEMARQRKSVIERKQAERQKAKRLRADMQDWEASNRIRAYLAALRAQPGEDPDQAEWLTWAETYANHLDPMVDFRIEVLDAE